jgi:hypothetical protein
VHSKVFEFSCTLKKRFQVLHFRKALEYMRKENMMLKNKNVQILPETIYDSTVKFGHFRKFNQPLISYLELNIL